MDGNRLNKLMLRIIGQENKAFFIIVSKRDGTDSTIVVFNPETKALTIDEKTRTGKLLGENEHQFRKLLHNKHPASFFVGFSLAFSIIDHKDIEAFNYKLNTIVTEGGHVFVKNDESKDLVEIFTDGSFNETLQQGAFGFAVFKNGRILDEIYEQSSSKSAAHLELLAVIAALMQVKDQRLKIITDSQYVRKGITEWIYHWQENNFTTANGTKAKNVDDWRRLSQLVHDRYIEWVWIKGHRDNEIHNRVDHYVRLKTEEQTKGDF